MSKAAATSCPRRQQWDSAQGQETGPLITILDFEGAKVLINHLPNDLVVLHGGAMVRGTRSLRERRGGRAGGYVLLKIARSGASVRRVWCRVCFIYNGNELYKTKRSLLGEFALGGTHLAVLEFVDVTNDLVRLDGHQYKTGNHVAAHNNDNILCQTPPTPRPKQVIFICQRKNGKQTW